MSVTPITITELDQQRLERLLDSGSAGALPGASLLRAELDRANVVDSREIDADIVTMNSTVQFVNEESGKSYELSLVYPDQAGVPGTVSILAPVGSALLGLKVGQSIEWQVQGGKQLRLQVTGVVGQPESLGEYHR
ncbi:MAG: nucleoside diphosphate kinase regulator [Halioglobus sp.]|nr:nucleoside diphosphate kinase regulator [Halioglobus sp.]